jgi:hypothetical protein
MVKKIATLQTVHFIQSLMFLAGIVVLFESCSKNEPEVNSVIDPPAITPPVVNDPDTTISVEIDTLSVGWSKITVSGEGTFSDIVFINEYTGFLVGEKGLYKSVDGGKTWKMLTMLVKGDAFMAATQDEKIFIIMSKDADNLYSSFDGGVNFSVKKMNASSPLTNISFSGNDTGYIPSGKNSLFRTTDGGHNWEALTPVSGLELIDGYYFPFFINGTTGWISDKARIFHNNGSVNEWEACAFFEHRNNGYLTIFAADSNIIYAAEATRNQMSLFKSLDRGRHFSLAATISLSFGSYPDIHFTDINTGYLVNYQHIFTTTDGGVSWNRVVLMSKGFLTKIYFTDANHGWACGNDGTVLIFKK